MNYNSNSPDPNALLQLQHEVQQSTLWQIAKNQARVAKMRSMYTILLNHHVKKKNYSYLSDDPDFLRACKELEDLKEPETAKNLLITINPPEDYPLQALQLLVTAIRTKKNFLDDMTLCYEVRTEDHKGLHCHIFTESLGPPKNDIIKRIYQSASQIRKKHYKDQIPEIPQTSIDVKSVSSKAEDYVKGIKQDETKMDKMKFTIDYRSQNELEPYYEFSKDFAMDLSAKS